MVSVREVTVSMIYDQENNNVIFITNVPMGGVAVVLRQEVPRLAHGRLLLQGLVGGGRVHLLTRSDKL